jgi:hypothetical protein
MCRNLSGEPAAHGAYYDAIGREDARLEQKITDIRAREDAGTITVRQAADERIAAMEEHLAACRFLRRRHLGGS